MTAPAATVEGWTKKARRRAVPGVMVWVWVATGRPAAVAVTGACPAAVPRKKKPAEPWPAAIVTWVMAEVHEVSE